ncbi:MAG: OmpA family protein [Bacteroidota bacterium]|nr:OmpA family protein [Bacteroidota bacterium]
MNTVPGGGFRGSAEYYFPTTSVHSFGLKLYTGKEFLYGRDKHKTPDYFRTNLLLLGFGASYALETNGQFFPFASAGFSYQGFHIDGIGEKNKAGNSPNYKSLGIDGELGVNIALSKSLLLSLSGAYHFLPGDYLDGFSSGKYTDFYITASVGISYAITFGSKYKKAETKPPRQLPEPKTTNPPIANNVPKTLSENKQNSDTGKTNENKSLTINISDFDSLSHRLKKVEKLSDIPTIKDTVSQRQQTKLSYNDEVPGKEKTMNSNLPATIRKKSNSSSDKTEKERTKANQESIKKTKLAIKTPEHESTTIKNKKSKIDDSEKEMTTGEVTGPSKNARSPKEILLHGELTFVRDETTIQPEAYAKLDEVARTIKANPGTKWKIEAYTDNHGNEKELQLFSLKRAQAILKYLTKKGISPTQFKVEGKGSKDPIEDNSNVWGRMMNRRVIIKRVE